MRLTERKQHSAESVCLLAASNALSSITFAKSALTLPGTLTAIAIQATDGASCTFVA